MRENLPVTNTERNFDETEILVSKTDTKGIITYCNASFCRVAGYSESELLGQPHNLIGHPDVPAELFRDLWDTVRAGKTWSGPVKNRCKNGDYY